MNNGLSWIRFKLSWGWIKFEIKLKLSLNSVGVELSWGAVEAGIDLVELGLSWVEVELKLKLGLILTITYDTLLHYDILLYITCYLLYITHVLYFYLKISEHKI